MKLPERSSYTPLDFLQWQQASGLVISPKFQRRGVWNRAARSYLIDTLLLGLPVPPIYIRVVQSADHKSIIREVVDGQQRVSAVLDFVADKYTLGRKIEYDAIGRKFSDLKQEEKDRILQYSFVCEVFYGVEDRDILKIFARLNTHSVRLNSQELRNGKFFGDFKKTVYALALEHLEFWRQKRIFTETAIARMQEVELSSELLILMMAGMQDKKKSIDEFYEKHDEEFADSKNLSRRFRSVIDEINSLNVELGGTEFRRTPLFYSLFAAIYDRMYALPAGSLTAKATGKMTAVDREGLENAIQTLSEVVTAAKAKADDAIPKRYERFVAACLRQTDNLAPRRTRMETIYKLAFA